MFSIQVENVTLAAASAVLQQQLYNNLIDFDNHLDNLSLDWLNTEFSNWVEKTSGYDMGRRLMINKSVSWQLDWDEGMKQIKFWYIHFWMSILKCNCKYMILCFLIIYYYLKLELYKSYRLKAF